MSGPDPERPMVFKFGGACFLNLSDYRTVARYIGSRLQESSRVLAVVSAMSGTSGNLQNAQRDLHARPPAALAAALLVTADTVSAILLATAICELNVSARTLGAHDEGMSAAGSPDRAQLTKIDPAPLWSAFATTDVVVMPGGQAVDDSNRVVTLGRNSSDLSAVAAAVALNAESCEIFSDVPGVYTADPYLLPEARVVPELGYAAAKQMSRAGAKVLHPKAVELAERHQIPIVCRTKPPGAERGTVIYGNSAPATIIADTRSSAWAFTDIDALERARKRLMRERSDDEGAETVVVDHDGVRHLVVPGGDPDGAAHRICAAAPERKGLRLLTTVRGAYEPERTLVPEADLLSEARRRHELHYPRSEGPRGDKQRSPMSGILTDTGERSAPASAVTAEGFPGTTDTDLFMGNSKDGLVRNDPA